MGTLDSENLLKARVCKEGFSVKNFLQCSTYGTKCVVSNLINIYDIIAKCLVEVSQAVMPQGK